MMEVAGYNPGALTVVQRLQWYNDYNKILDYLREEELVGANLWLYYKDVCKEDLDRLVRAVICDMARAKHDREKDLELRDGGSLSLSLNFDTNFK